MKSVQQENELLKGPIYKVLIKLLVPIMLAQMLQSAYRLIDAAWVGRLSTEAVAAVALSTPITVFMVALGAGLAIAGSILVSQYMGKGDKAKVDFAAGQTVMMLILAGGLLAGIGYVFSEKIVMFLGATPEVVPLAVDYLQIYFLGAIPIFLYFGARSLMRSIGEVKKPLYIVGMALVLNAILDPLFIVGWGVFPGFGVKGAAWTTVCTQTLAALVCLWIFKNEEYPITLKFSNLRLRLDWMKRLLKLGVPPAVEQSITGIILMSLTMIVGLFGTDVLAAYGVGNSVFAFLILPAAGLSHATATLVGQSIGAGMLKRTQEVVRKSMSLAALMMGMLGVLAFVFAELIVSVFLPGDVIVVAEAVNVVRFSVVALMFVGIQQALNGAFTGSGNVGILMWIGGFGYWGIQLPTAWVLSQYTELAQMGIWLSFPIAIVVRAGMYMWIYKKGNWIKKKTI